MSTMDSHSKKPSAQAAVFSTGVYALLRQIPRGKVASYADIAHALGRPRAARAVGNACNRNPDSPVVPCHRVVASDGSLGGYAFGLDEKIRLLKKEGVLVKDNRVVDFERVRHRFGK